MIKFFICFESFLDIFTVPIATWDPSTDFDIDWLHRVSIGKRDHLAKKNSINSNNKKSRLLQRNFYFSDGARGGAWSLLRPRPASPHWIWIPFKGFIGINSDSSPQYNSKIKPPFFRMRVFFFWWCPRGDLNPHTFRHTHLKRTCLPFHHLGIFSGPIILQLNKINGAPSRVRTYNQRFRRPLLFQLSYGCMSPYFGASRRIIGIKDEKSNKKYKKVY